jgi:hypothetical protein
MDRPQDRTNLQKNLVLLVESCSSVAGLCRSLDINRQQFNKYLAGQHAPSHKVLQKISRHFMMEVPDLYRQPADFKQFYEGFESELPMGLRSSSQFATFLPFAKSSVEPLRDYLGVYYRYHNSSIYKGRILRSVTCIYEAESTIQHVTVERFPLLVLRFLLPDWGPDFHGRLRRSAAKRAHLLDIDAPAPSTYPLLVRPGFRGSLILVPAAVFDETRFWFLRQRQNQKEAFAKRDGSFA